MFAANALNVVRQCADTPAFVTRNRQDSLLGTGPVLQIIGLYGLGSMRYNTVVILVDIVALGNGGCELYATERQGGKVESFISDWG